MRHKIENVIEWVSVPALLLGTIFTYAAAGFAPLLNFALCLTGVILAGRALHGREYFLAAGFVALTVAASPFPIGSRIFLLMGLACIGATATAFTVFRTQPAPTT
ncbi:MAG: hypothetical protein WBY44_10880 [Bryobacteraceae bacterium]|jgi:hypothetical protein